MFLTVKEFCSRTHFGDNAVRVFCRSAGFPCMRIGAKYFIDYDAAIEWLKQKAKDREFVKIKNLKPGC
ncbi:MAG: helix-turn-helix domain-containing protein [Bacillota bacterium]